MNSQIIFYLFFILIVIINVSFIFKASWWNKFQIWSLKKEEKISKNILFYHKIVQWEMKFAKSKRGPWLFRWIGIIWLSYTIYLLVSFLIYAT